MDSSLDTIAAIATPIGEGSIGVIRLSGTRAISIVAALFQTTKPITWTQVPSNTAHYGIFGRPAEPLDQAIATLFRTPHSYTGEDVVEISGHGNPHLLSRLLSLCLSEGARLAGPGEFTQRAFINGKLDLTQAEAVADLIRSKTEDARKAAWGQLEGRLANEVRRVRDHLLPLLAHVEVAMDHSDEGHEFLARDGLVEQCQHILRTLDALLASAHVGKVLREGFRVALVGRPNVGKSSLLNALLREDRAIVTPIAGTTRDTLEETIDWDGVPVVLTDTAGLRTGAQDPVEQLGIERSRKVIQEADLLLIIQDGSQPLTPEDTEALSLATQKAHLIVSNKADLFSSQATPKNLEKEDGNKKMKLSALTGEGMSALIQTVKEMALRESAGTPEARWMLNARHAEILARTRASLVRAVKAAEQGAYEEVIALELKSALSSLGEMIGETTTEDLLGQIFANFCVGK